MILRSQIVELSSILGTEELPPTNGSWSGSDVRGLLGPEVPPRGGAAFGTQLSTVDSPQGGSGPLWRPGTGERSLVVDCPAPRGIEEAIEIVTELTGPGAPDTFYLVECGH